MELSSDQPKTAGDVVKEINMLIDPVDQNQAGAREALLALSHRLTAMLEEIIQKIGWVEVLRLII